MDANDVIKTLQEMLYACASVEEGIEKLKYIREELDSYLKTAEAQARMEG